MALKRKSPNHYFYKLKPTSAKSGRTFSLLSGTPGLGFPYLLESRLDDFPTFSNGGSTKIRVSETSARQFFLCFSSTCTFPRPRSFFNTKNNVLYVQLPEQVGKPNKSALEFTKRLETLVDNKIINLWKSCPLERSDFHVLDNHPNVEGYKKIKRCITENKDINNFIKS